MTGRDAIKAQVASFQPPENRGKHLMENVVITVEGDSAQVRADFMFIAPGGPPFTVGAAGRYHERLVRSGEDWVFAEITIIPFGTDSH